MHILLKSNKWVVVALLTLFSIVLMMFNCCFTSSLPLISPFLTSHGTWSWFCVDLTGPDCPEVFCDPRVSVFPGQLLRGLPGGIGGLDVRATGKLIWGSKKRVLQLCIKICNLLIDITRYSTTRRCPLPPFPFLSLLLLPNLPSLFLRLCIFCLF